MFLIKHKLENVCQTRKFLRNEKHCYRFLRSRKYMQLHSLLTHDVCPSQRRLHGAGGTSSLNIHYYTRTNFNCDYLFTQTYLTYVAREGRRRLTHTAHIASTSRSVSFNKFSAFGIAVCTLKLDNYLLGTKTKLTIGQIS